MNWFVWLLFGHFFGDFLLQNKWMALNKKTNIDACLSHCFLYTCVVCACLACSGLRLQSMDLVMLLFIGIFLSHYVLDRTYLVDNWMKFYGIRSWDTDLNRDGFNNAINWDKPLTTRQAVQTAFGAIVYVVIDNTLHLFMMFVLIKLLML